MKADCEHYLSPAAWVLKEEGWDRRLQQVREARMSQGNGYLGIRGVLEEMPYDARPGTYIAGLYDRLTTQEADLINLPNPLQFSLMVGGEKLGVGAMRFARHKQWLDLRNGLVVRRTLFQDRHKWRFDYQSVRFVSMADPHVVAMQVCLTPLDRSVEITVKSSIDVSVWNTGVLTEGRKCHFQLAQVFQTADLNYLCVRTLDRGVLVGYASQLTYELGKRRKITTEEAFRIKVKRGQTVRFTKLICIRASGSDRQGVVERETMSLLARARGMGFDKMLKRHTREMHKRWSSADIVLTGDPAIQKALRFNVYHMLICGPQGEGEASIGARTLSGEGYRGHVFWDTEIFLFPFYLFTNPQVAKNMLLYRYYRLDAARQLAKEAGNKGARFPWESAGTGEEVTPSWARDYDGRIIPVRTGEMELHIVADVAYAVSYYATATGDEEFMLRHGYEIMFETARFWASRVRYNRRTRQYDIRHVIGPDEFHEEVHNNAFTNMMAKWNLRMAYMNCRELQHRHPAVWRGLGRRLKLTPKEVARWREIASNITVRIRADRVIEQFDGYFRRRPAKSPLPMANDLPDIPVGLDLSKIGKTQYLKQADVVMALHLHPAMFSRRTKTRNYRYYVSRTLHKSSLSPAVHAIVGNEVGDFKPAYKYFLIALRTDLENRYGNTESGVHGGCLGGVWQAVVNGFGGLRVSRGGLRINPSLPAHWRRLAFQLFWHGAQLRVSIDHRVVRLALAAKQRSLRVPVRIGSRRYELRPGQVRRFRYDGSRRR